MVGMNRRGFLTRSGLALGALVVGDEALEAFARLTHVRKSFPSAALRPSARWQLHDGSGLAAWSDDGNLWQVRPGFPYRVSGRIDGRFYTPTVTLTQVVPDTAMIAVSLWHG